MANGMSGKMWFSWRKNSAPQSTNVSHNTTKIHGTSANNLTQIDNQCNEEEQPKVRVVQYPNSAKELKKQGFLIRYTVPLFSCVAMKYSKLM